MQQIDQEYKLRCLNGNKALTLCINNSCPANATMCDHQQCPCQTPHLDCPGTISLSKLRRVFNTKNQSLQPLLNQVYNGYKKQSKMINIEMEELKKKIDNQELAFYGVEKNLYQRLISGNAKDLVPKMVNEAMNSLNKQPRYDVSERVTTVKKILEQKQKQLETILKELRKLANLKESIQFVVPSGIKKALQILNAPNLSKTASLPESKTTQNKTTQNKTILKKTSSITFPYPATFSPKLKHQKLSLSNDKTVRSNSFLEDYLTVVVEPAIPQMIARRVRVQFKVNQTESGYFMFGVCQMAMTSQQTNTDIYNKILYGSFTSGYNSTIYLGQQEGHRRESSKISPYKQGNVIEVQYETETQKVTVTNLTQNEKSVSYIKIDSTLPLYFAVLLLSSFDEVSIVKGEQE